MPKTDDIYKDIAENIETRFGSSNCQFNRALPKGKNKKVIGLIKDELGGKIMKKFVGFKAKTYIYLRDDGSKDKKCKRQNKVCHEKKTCI